MDALYRVFYVIFAMDLVAIVLFPVVLVLRFLMRDMHRKYVVWIWRFYFLRILCPISISSVFCIVPGWNRFFHQILLSLGLSLQGNYGLLTGWHTVFETEIETTIQYRFCAWVWMVGCLFLCVVMCIRQRKIRQEIKRNAVQLEGRIYQSAVQTPVLLGWFRCRYYLPKQIQAKQLRYLLPHMEAQRKRKSQWWRILGFLVLILHWYHPFVWAAYALAKRDEAMACDDLAIKQLGTGESLLYAQSLLNLAKDEVIVPYTISTIFETDLEKRATRMLYYRPNVLRQRVSALFLTSLLLLWIFGLRPLQMAWKGGTWGQGEISGSAQSVSEARRQDHIIGSCKVTSSNGLELLLRLVMTNGEYTDNQYKGKFTLELLDSMGGVLDSISLKQSWERKGLSTESMVFSEDLLMQTGDYNGDGLPEILLGQQTDWTDEQRRTVQDVVFPVDQTSGETEYIYLMYQIGEKDLAVVSDPIYALGRQGQESAIPLTEEGIEDLFAVNVPQGKNYYVWDMDGEQYQREKMSQEMLNQHREASKGTAETGVQNTVTLKDSNGKVQMWVETRNDTTGSPEIRSIGIGSEDQSKKMDKLEGYFCDLQWAVSEDDIKERYAVLIYNGTKAQTFVVYDVEQKREYYRQEDGNSILADAFAQYNGSDISFAEGGLAVYSLQSRKEDTLKISFAADADGGKTVKGSYEYQVDDKRVKNLSFSQTTDTQGETGNEGNSQSQN